MLLLAAHLHLSYDFNQGWWHSAAATVLIFLPGWLIWRNRFFQVAGLRIPRSSIVPVAVCTAVSTLLSLAIMTWLAGDRVAIAHSSAGHYLHNVFYILNEEVVFGALLLYFMRVRISVRPEIASGLLAVIVALGHLAFYRWYFRDQGMLIPAAVVTLFFVAFAKNNLIIRFGHIAYAWALHFGWMVIMYGCLHHDTSTQVPLTDLQKFNLYLGAFPVMLLTALIAAFTLLIPNRKPATFRSA